MQKNRGLTIIEALLILIIIGIGAIVFFHQKSELDALGRDDTRKSAINAIYYALEESYYKDNGYYPEYINPEVLSVINPDNFTDPSGHQLGDSESSYSYQAADCYLGHCKEYILKTTLEKEATFAKYSLSHTKE